MKEIESREKYEFNVSHWDYINKNIFYKVRFKEMYIYLFEIKWNWKVSYKLFTHKSLIKRLYSHLLFVFLLICGT